MKATRDAFGEQLVESSLKNEEILVLSADLGKATKVDKFSQLFPNRFFEVGIAENNMIGIASGLSENGFKVFLTSFSSFLTGKYDTIRCSISYSNCPVILVGTHGGLAIGRDGVTQMGLEDISLMRSLPNMVVLNPSTYIETKKMVEYLCNSNLSTPHYLRLGRQPIEEIFDNNYEFNFNKCVTIKEGYKNTVFSTGCILPNVVKATENIDINVINIHTIKPIDYESIIKYCSESKYVFTVEDHSIIGGIGSVIAEIIAENGLKSKLIRIGLNDIFPESGSPSDLYEKYGLSINKISKKISETLNEN